MDNRNSTDKSKSIATEHTKCVALQAHVLEKDEEVHKMIDSIEALGCKLPPNFFTCRKCTLDITGGFKVESSSSSTSSSGTTTPNYIPKIIACENKAKAMNETVFRNTMVHELIHAYDFCRSNMDTRNCKILACTEIRASALSGECSMTEEMKRGINPKVINIWDGYRNCVKRRAGRSLNMTVHCKGVSEKAVEAVWDTCFKDEKPLDKDA